MWIIILYKNNIYLCTIFFALKTQNYNIKWIIFCIRLLDICCSNSEMNMMVEDDACSFLILFIFECIGKRYSI